MRSSVLVVEDYADLRSAIEATLVRRDYSCDSASSVDDAIVKLRTHEYSAILLAPTLPIKDDRIIRYLVENSPGELWKVILMTDPPDAQEDRYRVLAKPFNNEELFAKLPPASTSRTADRPSGSS
jgi:DNA-binding response OmpR family regulator